MFDWISPYAKKEIYLKFGLYYDKPTFVTNRPNPLVYNIEFKSDNFIIEMIYSNNYIIGGKATDYYFSNLNQNYVGLKLIYSGLLTK